LIEASRIIYHTKQAAKFGIDMRQPYADFARINQHIQKVIAAIKPHDSVDRFESLGVTVIKSMASFIDDKTVQANGCLIKAKYFVLATGSRPRIFPITGLETIDYFTNETIFDLKEKPEHLLVVGGGPIGAEIAESYALLGAKVTIFETANSILNSVDDDCKKVVISVFEKLGIKIITNVNITNFSTDGKIKTVHYKHNNEHHKLSFSHILMATGRIPNLEHLKLEKANIQYTKMGISVDQHLRTNHKHIYAIGDLASPYQFTHVANYHAGIAIQNILFKIPAKVNYKSLPWVIYTAPEIAQSGINLTVAAKQGAEILNFPYKDHDRAQAALATDGLVKIAVDKSGNILGVSIVGESAGELISQWSMAIKNKLKIKHMANFIAPYPTLSEMNKRIAGQFFTPLLYSRKIQYLVRFLLKLKWFRHDRVGFTSCFPACFCPTFNACNLQALTS